MKDNVYGGFVAKVGRVIVKANDAKTAKEIMRGYGELVDPDALQFKQKQGDQARWVHDEEKKLAEDLKPGEVVIWKGIGVFTKEEA